MTISSAATILLLGSVLLPPAFAQGSKDGGVQAVRRLDSLWASTYATHDTTTALKLMGERFIMTSTDGSQKGRDKELHDVRAVPDMTVDYFRTADVSVYGYPSAVVVTGRLEWRTSSGGRSRDVARRYTATWVPGGPLGWQLVALQVGRVPGT